MAADESTLPAKVTEPFDGIDWTLAIEGSEIFSSAFLQILADIVFEFALFAKRALLW
jgi:hypothetical protein